MGDSLAQCTILAFWITVRGRSIPYHHSTGPLVSTGFGGAVVSSSCANNNKVVTIPVQSVPQEPEWASRVMETERNGPTKRHLSTVKSGAVNIPGVLGVPSLKPMHDKHPQESDQLFPDWIALHDPASAQTYHANQTTCETCWDRPQPTGS